MSMHRSYAAAKTVAQEKANETRETWAVYRMPEWPSGAHGDVELGVFHESSLSLKDSVAFLEPVYPARTIQSSIDDLSVAIADLKRRVSLLEKRLSDDG